MTLAYSPSGYVHLPGIRSLWAPWTHQGVAAAYKTHVGYLLDTLWISATLALVHPTKGKSRWTRI